MSQATLDNWKVEKHMALTLLTEVLEVQHGRAPSQGELELEYQARRLKASQALANERARQLVGTQERAA